MSKGIVKFYEMFSFQIFKCMVNIFQVQTYEAVVVVPAALIQWIPQAPTASLHFQHSLIEQPEK